MRKSSLSTIKLRPSIKNQISVKSNSVTNENSEAQMSYSDKQLRLSAVVDEGMIAVTSAKNKIAISTNIAVSPVHKMLDKAEWDNHSASPYLLSSIFVRKEGRGGGAIPQLTALYDYGSIYGVNKLQDGGTASLPTHPVARAIFGSPVYCSGGQGSPGMDRLQ